jgi:hypothetical protein
VCYLVTLAWQRAGGTGDPPKDLLLVFALNFSAFTTRALMVDFDQTLAQIGVLTAEILKMLLWRAVEAQGKRADADSGARVEVSATGKRRLGRSSAPDL